jgi:hypothetical protein
VHVTVLSIRDAALQLELAVCVMPSSCLSRALRVCVCVWRGISVILELFPAPKSLLMLTESAAAMRCTPRSRSGCPGMRRTPWWRRPMRCPTSRSFCRAQASGGPVWTCMGGAIVSPVLAIRLRSPDPSLCVSRLTCRAAGGTLESGDARAAALVGEKLVPLALRLPPHPAHGALFTLRRSALRRAVPCCDLPCCALPCCALPCCALPCCAVLCCAVLCRVVPCCAVPCCAVLCRAVL